MVERERNRRRLLPTVAIGQEPEPSRSPETGDDDERIIKDFRDRVRRRLGALGVAVLDARLGGKEMKGLADSPLLGSPGKNRIKAVVGRIKELAREYAIMRGDPEMLRRVERAMQDEEATVAKRRATMAGRRAAVA
jgi:hypothetical protein